MNDYDRFLCDAREQITHVARIAERLLSEEKIGVGTRDALTSASRKLLHAAYQAGRCEPDGVTDLDHEFRWRTSH